uniref:Uncharacterized protein n=1 Tax=Cacopsylla melanoneura TaxID=428564 RepID=A0A8D9E477_9HEMI
MSDAKAKIDLIYSTCSNLETALLSAKNSSLPGTSNGQLDALEKLFLSFKALVMIELPLLKDQLEKQETRLNHMEQYSRRNCLLIHGVREEDGAQTEDECVAMALQIFNANMQIAMNGSAIDRAHRIGGSRDTTRKKNPKKNRPIIVKFVSYFHRRLVFTQKSRLKASGIYITESLTRENFKVLNEAKQIYSMNNVWTNDGRILIKDGAHIHTVTSSLELQNLSVQKMRKMAMESNPSSPVLPSQQRVNASSSTSNNSSFNMINGNVTKPAPVSNIPVPVPTGPKKSPKARPKKSPVAQKYNRNKRNK